MSRSLRLLYSIALTLLHQSDCCVSVATSCFASVATSTETSRKRSALTDEESDGHRRKRRRLPSWLDVDRGKNCTVCAENEVKLKRKVADMGWEKEMVEREIAELDILIELEA